MHVAVEKDLLLAIIVFAWPQNYLETFQLINKQLPPQIKATAKMVNNQSEDKGNYFPFKSMSRLRMFHIGDTLGVFVLHVLPWF